MQRMNSHGFTALEVIFTIVIAGLLMAYHTVPLQSKAYAEAAAKKLSMDIRYARDMALSTGSRYGVYHVNGADTYKIYKEYTYFTINDPLQQYSPTGEDLKKFRGVSMSNGFQFEFDSMGRPILGAGTTVNLTDGTLTKQVRVVPNTGYVEIL